METISHHRSRIESAEILRRVAAGESFHTFNGGAPAATTQQLRVNRVEDLIAKGQARPATKPISSILGISRRTIPDDTSTLIEDIRASR